MKKAAQGGSFGEAMNTYYDVLSVKPDAPAEVIRAAYRALSQTWHPDRNNSPDAALRMQELNLAYETLSDPLKRRKYDDAASFHCASGTNSKPSHHRYNEHTGAPRRGAGFVIDEEKFNQAVTKKTATKRGRSLVKWCGIMLFPLLFIVAHLITSYQARHRA